MRDRTRARRRATGLVLTAALVACRDEAPSVTAAAWPQADELFRRDSRWIGGDGAYSVDLGGGRVLWTFGDSFIADVPQGGATTVGRSRDRARMVRNSVAVQHGYDPSRAFMRFYWREGTDGAESFLAEEGARWFWPSHGARIDDVLILFWEQVEITPGKAPGPWTFRGAGWTASLVKNPDDEPSRWVLSPVRVAPIGDLVLGEAVVRDGDRLYVYASEGPLHAVHLVRFRVDDVKRGVLDEAEAWYGSRGWSRVVEAPEPLFGAGAPELSVHHDAVLDRWVMVESQGYGATTLAMRVAGAPQGPWSPPRDVLRPPESFEPRAFVYAGKAHPELRGADLVLTYVPSRFDALPPSAESALYYPHFARVTYR